MNAAAAAPRTASALHSLVLARLAVPRKSPYTLQVLTKDLQPYCPGSPEAARQTLADAVQLLIDDGLVSRDRKRLALTEAGRVAALAFLGVAELPAKLTWSQCRSAYVLPTLLGAAVTERQQRQKLQKPDGLCAALLKLEHDLPLDAAPSYAAALAMVLCRELGIPPVQKVTANVLTRWLLEKRNGERRQISDKDLPKHLLFTLVGADKTDMNSLRNAAIRLLLTAPTEPEADAKLEREEPPFNLSGFAEAVLEAARSSPTGRFGDNKVFIHHVWKQLEASRAFPHLGYDAFQQHLIAANQEGLLHLSRLDLVDLFPPAEVAAAETRHHHAVFHFVQV